MRENRNFFIYILGASVAMLAMAEAAPPAIAVERGGINLGATSFFDGFAGFEPGCAYIHYMGHNQFDQYNGPHGEKLPAPVGDADLSVSYFVAQIVCNSDLKLFGGTIGWDTIIPLAGHASGFLATNGTGVGDISIGPSLQFPPLMVGGRPVFSQGFGFDVIVPAGKYDPEKCINPGNDYWSINPSWKASWLPAAGWEASWRISYIHNFDHLTPVNASGPGGASIKTNGDGVWVNFTASRELSKDLYLGVNGYWLRQFTGDTGANGARLADTRQEFLYLGPGLHYMLNPKNIFNVNVYMPVSNVNAMSGGYQANLQYVHPLN